MAPTFADRAQKIEEEAVEFAANYIASRPVGSWISKEMFDHAMAGWRVDFKKVNERLAAADHKRAAWFVMNPTGGLAGLIIGDETVVKGLAQMPKQR